MTVKITLSSTARIFLWTLGKRLTEASSNKPEMSYLFWRFSVVAQRFYSVLKHMSLVPAYKEQDFWPIATFSPQDLNYQEIVWNNSNVKTVITIFTIQYLTEQFQ